MSQTIGITIKNLSEPLRSEAEQRVKDTAKAHGYGVSFGSSSCVEETREGVATLARSWKTNFFAFLHHPTDAVEAEAWQIGRALSPGGERSDFFKFLNTLYHVFSRFTSEFSIFFAIDWNAKDKVRFREGPFESLIKYLSRPCGWAEALYIPESDSFWCDDEVPVIFTVRYPEESQRCHRSA